MVFVLVCFADHGFCSCIFHRQWSSPSYVSQTMVSALVCFTVHGLCSRMFHGPWSLFSYVSRTHGLYSLIKWHYIFIQNIASHWPTGASIRGREALVEWGPGGGRPLWWEALVKEGPDGAYSCLDRLTTISTRHLHGLSWHGCHAIIHVTAAIAAAADAAVAAGLPYSCCVCLYCCFFCYLLYTLGCIWSISCIIYVKLITVTQCMSFIVRTR